MLQTLITIGFVWLALSIGFAAGAMFRASYLRRELADGRLRFAGVWYTVTPEVSGWAPPLKPVDTDLGAAKVISIVRAAIAAGAMDAELAHSEAERARRMRKAGL